MNLLRSKVRRGGGIDCVLLIQNDKNIIEDNGKILQEKECELCGQKLKFKYCVYTKNFLKELKLPFFAYYDKNADYNTTLWFNSDYISYMMRKLLPYYKFYFYIEYDCFFNGDYKDFFKLFENDDTDLFLAHYRKEAENSKWCWTFDTAWVYEPKEWYGCFFPLYRISGETLDKLYLRKIELGKIYSQINLSKIKAQWLLCEIFIASEANKLGFSVKAMPNNKTGLNEIDLNTTRLFTFPDNQMYHPVKGNFLKRLKYENELIKAANRATWYRGGFIKFYFKIRKLIKEFKKRKLVYFRKDVEFAFKTNFYYNIILKISKHIIKGFFKLLINFYYIGSANSSLCYGCYEICIPTPARH